MTANAKRNYLIWLILAVGFLIRLAGIEYGLPALYNSDEPFNVANALAYGAKKSLAPTYFVYPAFYSYLLLAVYGLYFVFGTIFGVFANSLEFGVSYFIDPTGLFLAGRFLSVVLGTVAIWLTYRMGARHFSPQAGIFAAVFLALSYTHADWSHWILLEAALTAVCALALLLILDFFDTRTIRMALVASFVAGLAISTKYNAGLLILPLIAVFILQWKRIPQKISVLFLSFLFLGAGFLIASPYWLFSFSSYWQTLNYTVTHMSTGTIGHMASMPVVWPLWFFIFEDWTIGFLFVAGVLYACFRPDRKQIILLTLVVPALLFIGFWQRTGIHYLAPIFPALAVLAACFLSNIFQRSSKVVAAVLLVLILLPPSLKIMYKDIRLTQPDTRTHAQNWIESNIPPETRIGYENYVYGPNLFDPARFLKNSSESQLLPVPIKEMLLEESLRRISYRLVNLRKDFKLKALVEQNGSGDDGNAYVRQLLETRLPKLQSVKSAGVQYLVVSSDNYERYINEPPPPQNTPLWVSYQNGKRFYESLMHSDELLLLKTFEPGFWNLGPTIKIFQFKDEIDGSAN